MISSALQKARTEPEEVELKVRLPYEQRRRLHAIKALEGTPIKDAVREALELWFWVNGYPYDEERDI